VVATRGLQIQGCRLILVADTWELRIPECLRISTAAPPVILVGITTQLALLYSLKFIHENVYDIHTRIPALSNTLQPVPFLLSPKLGKTPSYSQACNDYRMDPQAL